ncbi:hypothetical protein [Prosthecobacter sp.]|uniref:hypothetical protein n=1 Tax=Prosthecobacter sp. TaxID=1965333 RepID=UPI0037850BA7
MNSATTASLICPACGQAFLSMQQSMEGMTQCPHCAHNAPRGYFGTQAQVAGVAQVRRRVSQTQPMQSMQPPPVQPPPHAPQAYAPPAAWPGMQTPPAQPPAHSIARPALHFSSALMPTGAPPPQPEASLTPPHLRTSPWRNAFIILAFAVVCCGALWLWWDSVGGPAASPAPGATPPAPTMAAQKTQVSPQPQIARAVIPEPDVAAFSADAKALVTELFAVDTPERRAACIHEAGKYGAEIEALFGPSAVPKIESRLLAPIAGAPLTLPGSQPTPLFKLVTSSCATGALLRLETGADGRRRISWPLLIETHSAALATYLKLPAADAAWFHMGLRPTHGLDIAAELRSKYITFDVQVSAGGVPHFVACVERDSPLGRFLDRETEWGRAYLARLLVRRLDIKADAPCLLVIDCEGATER